MLQHWENLLQHWVSEGEFYIRGFALSNFNEPIMFACCAMTSLTAMGPCGNTMPSVQLNIYIRECGSTLHVELVHAAPPTQYKAFTAFSTNWPSESFTSRYTCKEQQMSRPG